MDVAALAGIHGAIEAPARHRAPRSAVGRCGGDASVMHQWSPKTRKCLQIGRPHDSYAAPFVRICRG